MVLQSTLFQEIIHQNLFKQEFQLLMDCACHLPAFVILGIAPVVASVGMSMLSG